jgi:hypothetical protein
LQDAFFFREQGELVAITTQDGVDVILRLRENETGHTLGITLHNPGKEAARISGLLLTIPGQTRATILSPEDGAGFQAWSFRKFLVDRGTVMELDLSLSSILLLPDENLLLPTLELITESES